MKKCLPILLLGMIGMFLSELLIWNVSNFAQVLADGIGKAILLVVIGSLIYILLFAIFADVIQRFRVNDFTGVLIIGMIYGLLLEGIFATKVFEPGIGPCIGGLCFSAVAFTGLSWHPLIDFLCGFLILGLLFSGKLNIGNKKINAKETLVVILLSCFWFMWMYSQWNVFKMSSGISILVQAFVLFFPMIIFMILVPLTLYNGKISGEGKIFGKLFYSISMLILLAFALIRFKSLPNKISFFFYLGIILFYCGLFLLYEKSIGKNKDEKSFYSRCFPIQEKFSLVKYLKISGLVLITYVFFRILTKAFYLSKIYTFFSKIFFVLFLIFALAFPIWVIGKIFYNFMKK